MRNQTSSLGSILSMEERFILRDNFIWIPSVLNPNVRAISHTGLMTYDQCNVRSLIGKKRAETVQVPFTLEGEGLRTQRNNHGWKVYMNSYIPDHGQCFMVCWNLCKAHLQEVSLTQILAHHVRVKNVGQLVRPLNESQRPSQLHGHGPWLVCELVLIVPPTLTWLCARGGQLA